MSRSPTSAGLSNHTFRQVNMSYSIQLAPPTAARHDFVFVLPIDRCFLCRDSLGHSVGSEENFRPFHCSDRLIDSPSTTMSEYGSGGLTDPPGSELRQGWISEFPRSLTPCTEKTVSPAPAKRARPGSMHTKILFSRRVEPTSSKI